MMEDSDILTLGWGCEQVTPPNLWAPSGEEFVTLDVEEASKESQEFATLEVAKERDRQFFNTCVDTPDIKCQQVRVNKVFLRHNSQLFHCRISACQTGTSCAWMKQYLLPLFLLWCPAHDSSSQLLLRYILWPLLPPYLLSVSLSSMWTPSMLLLWPAVCQPFSTQ